MIGKCQGGDAETPRPVLDGGLGVIGSPVARRVFANRTWGPKDQTSMSCLGRVANHQPSQKIQLGSGLPASKQSHWAPREHKAPSRSPYKCEDRQATRRHSTERLFLFSRPRTRGLCFPAQPPVAHPGLAAGPRRRPRQPFPVAGLRAKIFSLLSCRRQRFEVALAAIHSQQIRHQLAHHRHRGAVARSARKLVLVKLAQRLVVARRQLGGLDQHAL